MKEVINLVILAAGKGTRLGIDYPKPLISFQSINLIHQVMNQACFFSDKFEIKTSVIVGHQKNQVIEYLDTNFPELELEYIHQDEQLGTGHAVKEFINQTQFTSNLVLILCADTPLIKKSLLSSLLDFFYQKDLVAAGLSFIKSNPFGYGRVVRFNNQPGLIVTEEKDASEEVKKIDEVNAGIYIIDQKYLCERVQTLNCENNSGEFYLTDIMDRRESCDYLLVTGGEKTLLGVNTMEELTNAEVIARKEIIKDHQRRGVRFLDINSVYIDQSVEIESSVTIMPNVHLRGNTKIKKGVLIETGTILINSIIGEDVTVLPYSIIEESEVKRCAYIGPFARIRPGSSIGENCKVGNFVETKKATLEAKSKVSHLSYVGDAKIGKESNIGCGFITCNYDGKNKHETIIGENCFIGSDSQMIAPVKIGDNCFVASGSTINKDLEDGDFAISRSRQIIKNGMAKKFLKK